MSIRQTGFWNAGLVTIIKANTLNYNLLSDLTAKFGYTGAAPALVRCIILPGVIVGSPSPSTPAFTVTGFPARSSITIENLGTIEGAGGIGGIGYNGSGSFQFWPWVATAGGNGGDALSIVDPIILDNRFGNIWSGGGAGGGSAGNVELFNSGGNDFYTLTTPGGGGGGAAGQNPGTGGVGGPGGNGATGTTTSGGNGGVPTGSSLVGGNGGIPGQPGTPGSNGFYTDTVASIYDGPIYGGQGGFAGKAINLNGQALSVITWLGGNNGIQVKGAVS